MSRTSPAEKTIEIMKYIRLYVMGSALLIWIVLMGIALYRNDWNILRIESFGVLITVSMTCLLFAVASLLTII